MAQLNFTREGNGLAFPLIITTKTSSSGAPIDVELHPGMTLRDYFAAQALAGQLAFSPDGSFEKANQPADVAALCYRFADAMLAERSK